MDCIGPSKHLVKNNILLDFVLGNKDKLNFQTQLGSHSTLCMRDKSLLHYIHVILFQMQVYLDPIQV